LHLAALHREACTPEAQGHGELSVRTGETERRQIFCFVLLSSKNYFHYYMLCLAVTVPPKSSRAGSFVPRVVM
jgi:hypothetical protein